MDNCDHCDQCGAEMPGVPSRIREDGSMELIGRICSGCTAYWTCQGCGVRVPGVFPDVVAPAGIILLKWCNACMDSLRGSDDE